MPIKILMPALSPTMTEGAIAKWHVKEGDTVNSGDVIAEIETDKATMEVEAVEEGTSGKIVFDEGSAGVAVNEVIALLLEEGEDKAELESVSLESPAKADSTPEAKKAGNGAAASEKKPEPKSEKPAAAGDESALR